MTSAGRAVVSLLTIVMSVVLTLGRQICDHCDCQISSAEGTKAVYSMSLVCNAGTITWFGADGGVRLELTPLVHTHFRACFIAESVNTHVRISQETPHHGNDDSVPPSADNSLPLSYSPRHNYQVKLLEEALDARALTGTSDFRLEPLLTSTSQKSKELCVNSGPGRPLHLFLETVPSPDHHGVPKVKFHYDVTKLTPETPQDPMDDCRPCTDEELLDSYCSMDFVVLGQMADVAHDDARGRSEITVHAKQVIHQREPHYFQRVKRSDHHLTGQVSVSSHCGLKSGTADMLLTGRLRLNSLALTCVTYLHKWRRIQGDVECSR